MLDLELGRSRLLLHLLGEGARVPLDCAALSPVHSASLAHSRRSPQACRPGQALPPTVRPTADRATRSRGSAHSRSPPGAAGRSGGPSLRPRDASSSRAIERRARGSTRRGRGRSRTGDAHGLRVSDGTRRALVPPQQSLCASLKTEGQHVWTTMRLATGSANGRAPHTRSCQSKSASDRCNDVHWTATWGEERSWRRCVGRRRFVRWRGRWDVGFGSDWRRWPEAVERYGVRVRRISRSQVIEPGC